MNVFDPASPAQLAGVLAEASAAGRTIALGGRFSKNRMAGPVEPAEIGISTRCLTRVLCYEPRDLTISVEAGMAFSELSRLLAASGQMVPLDPPFFDQTTVGAVVAANLSGPRRRLYGTVRDMVIGLKFATLEGKLIQSGGMVVKNVAGLDMAKLLIGSYGTLAAIAVVNFKLTPIPTATRTFLLSSGQPEAAIAARDSILRSVLQPTALDLLNPAASARLGRKGFVLALQAAGTLAVVERYARELPEAEALEGPAESEFWERIREFTPDFLTGHAGGAVVRISCTLSQVGSVIAMGAPVLVRAGSGVCYVYFENCEAATKWMPQTKENGWRRVIEFAPIDRKRELELWPDPGSDFEVMRKVKDMFDPRHLLNRGRLYGRI